MPNYALGQQVRKDDERIKASYETVPSPNGNGYIRGYFVRPFSADSRSETPAKVPGIIVVHENRGLNPHTEDVARRFALENFMAFCARRAFVSRRLSGRRLQGRPAIGQDRRRQEDPGFRRRCAVVEIASGLHRKNRRNRLCFGGSLTNTLAVLLGPDLAAAAPFYGGAPKPEDVPKIKAAILIHHGALDKGLSEAYPAQEAELKKNTSGTKATFIEFGSWVLQ